MSPQNPDVKNQQQAEEKNAEANQQRDDGTKERQEIGGPKGPEPTRYGDWEVAGRCSDF